MALTFRLLLDEAHKRSYKPSFWGLPVDMHSIYLCCLSALDGRCWAWSPPAVDNHFLAPSPGGGSRMTLPVSTEICVTLLASEKKMSVRWFSDGMMHSATCVSISIRCSQALVWWRKAACNR